jgi:ATP-dependent exoDNAse (exonuclease V) beta subunit
MFNQLTPAEVVTAIGATVRAAARSDTEASEFERDQLMSAYSYEPELRAFTHAVLTQLRASDIPELGAELPRLTTQLAETQAPAEVGKALCELFETLHRAASPQAEALRSEVHAHLRSLADREVDLLADALR